MADGPHTSAMRESGPREIRGAAARRRRTANRFTPLLRSLPRVEPGGTLAQVEPLGDREDVGAAGLASHLRDQLRAPRPSVQLEEAVAGGAERPAEGGEPECHEAGEGVTHPRGPRRARHQVRAPAAEHPVAAGPFLPWTRFG